MQIVNLPAGKGDVVKVSGDIDCHFSPRIHAILRVKIREEHPVLLLDCSDLDYIDSCGMAALIEYARDAKRFGGRLALVGLKPQLRNVFQLVHLDRQLILCESDEEARIAAAQSRNQ